MPAQLMALTEGPNILLDKPILMFGRHPECDIQLNSRKISRRHCCVAQVKDYLVVRDLGSTNGVRINGVRVTEGKLESGDELTIGNFRFQLSADPAAGTKPKANPVVARPVVPNRKKLSDSELEEADVPIPLEEDTSPKRLDRASASGTANNPPSTPSPPPPPPAPPPARKQVPAPMGTIHDEDFESLIIPDNLVLHPESKLNIPPP